MNQEASPTQEATVEIIQTNEVVANVHHFELIGAGDRWQLGLCPQPDWATDLDNKLRMRIREQPKREIFTSEEKAWQKVLELEAALARGETISY